MDTSASTWMWAADAEPPTTWRWAAASLSAPQRPSPPCPMMVEAEGPSSCSHGRKGKGRDRGLLAKRQLVWWSLLSVQGSKLVVVVFGVCHCGRVVVFSCCNVFVCSSSGR